MILHNISMGQLVSSLDIENQYIRDELSKNNISNNIHIEILNKKLNNIEDAINELLIYLNKMEDKLNELEDKFKCNRYEYENVVIELDKITTKFNNMDKVVEKIENNVNINTNELKTHNYEWDYNYTYSASCDEIDNNDNDDNNDNNDVSPS